MGKTDKENGEVYCEGVLKGMTPLLAMCDTSLECRRYFTADFRQKKKKVGCELFNVPPPLLPNNPFNLHNAPLRLTVLAQNIHETNNKQLSVLFSSRQVLAIQKTASTGS